MKELDENTLIRIILINNSEMAFPKTHACINITTSWWSTDYHTRPYTWLGGIYSLYQII